MNEQTTTAPSELVPAESAQSRINALTTTNGWTGAQVKLLGDTIAKGASADELKMFIAICGRTGLDPFTKQIHFVKRWDSKVGREVFTAQTGIDGYRLIAQRSGEYAGQDPPQWCGPDGAWTDVWLADTPPAAARVGVYRRGHERSTVATARWSAYCQTTKDGSLNQFWSKMGPEQLAKCAEALALRKAFPNELSGIYTFEEMDQAQNDHEPAAEFSCMHCGNISVVTPRPSTWENPRFGITKGDPVFKCPEVACNKWTLARPVTPVQEDPTDDLPFPVEAK